MMGAGKSAVGRALAEESEREFVDTDILIQNRFGRPVHQVFALYGEDAFRGHETSVLKGIQPGKIVLATGGGIVMRDANWVEMQRLGITIYLEATADTLIERLEQSKKKRPLLVGQEMPDRIAGMLEERRCAYERADLSVRVDGLMVSDVAAKVLCAIDEWSVV